PGQRARRISSDCAYPQRPEAASLSRCTRAWRSTIACCAARGASIEASYAASCRLPPHNHLRHGELEGSGRAPLAPEWTSAARCTSPRRTTERSEVNVIRHDGGPAEPLPQAKARRTPSNWGPRRYALDNVVDRKHQSDELRQEMAKLDQQLLAALDKRARAARRLRELRKDNVPQIPVADHAAIRSLVSRSTGDMPAEALR